VLLGSDSASVKSALRMLMKLTPDFISPSLHYLLYRFVQNQMPQNNGTCYKQSATSSCETKSAFAIIN